MDDRNTRFFHIASTKREKRNNTLAIRNAEEVWKADSAMIKKIFVEYYKQLFTSAKLEPISKEFYFRASIPSDDTIGLSSIPSAEEIETVIKI